MVKPNYLFRRIHLGCMEDDPSVESEGSTQGQRARGGRSYLNESSIFIVFDFPFCLFDNGVIYICFSDDWIVLRGCG